MTEIIMMLGVIVALVLYLLPTIVAHNRRHHQTHAISVLNILLGWTLLGWVGALVWAVTATPDQAPKAPVKI